MKLTSTLLPLAALVQFVPATLALIDATWSMTNAPPGGLSDITFPMRIDMHPYNDGYFMAQQVQFVKVPTGSGGFAYIGLETHMNSTTGQIALSAIFGSTMNRTEPASASCRHGAHQGREGVVCNTTTWNGAGREYQLEIKNTGNTTWAGIVRDTVTGQHLQIGVLTLEDGIGGIMGDEGKGMVEWTPWTDDDVNPDHCDTLPYGSFFLGNPTTTHESTVGTQDEAHESGDCIDQVNFVTEPALAFGFLRVGIDMNCGTPGQTGE
ncbi:hypothetical protein FB45DRAFT_1061671 [Roridomyces roridus]|uniref:Uncharacterized protein n=1 Tax=Roridomyces roridus TaxID=1738132 RepID=A0AAD7BI24_9AGAR|nr:hypothetical protein FB45DRAFT_1061671 [Roridomyces roridus]